MTEQFRKQFFNISFGIFARVTRSVDKYIWKLNLVPRAHVPFGQHQDTELWNNQFPETKILGLPASQRMRGLVYMVSGDKVDVDTFHKGIQYALERLRKSKFGLESTTVSNFKSKSHEGSGNELVDYSRAPCLGADQKARGLWERDCWKLFCRIRNQIAAHAQKGAKCPFKLYQKVLLFHDSPVCPQASRTWSRRKLCHLFPDRHKNL